MIDTHSHIYLPEFADDLSQVVDRAVNSGVTKIILPNIDTESIPQIIQVNEQYKELTEIAWGLHPTSVDADYMKQLKTIEHTITNSSCCAIGEIGIDLYWDKTYFKEQLIVFEKQLDWACELNLPVIIHSRNAFPEIFTVLRKDKFSNLKGVFHSFSGELCDVEAIQAMGGFYFGINGVLTFKNASLQLLVNKIGIDKILLETDAPYLSPVPKRGKRNEPSFLNYINIRLSELLKLPPEQANQITTANAKQLFSI